MKKSMYFLLVLLIVMPISCSKEDYLTSSSGRWRVTELIYPPPNGSVPNDPTHPNSYIEFGSNKTWVIKYSDSNGDMTNSYDGNWELVGSDEIKLTYLGSECSLYTINELTATSLHLVASGGSSCSDGIWTSGAIDFKCVKE